MYAVPCLRRAASVEEEYEAAGGEVLLDNEDNDGWLATHGKPKGLSITVEFTYKNLLWPVTCTSLIYIVFLSTESKSDDDENLPSMDTLDISKKSTIQSISSYFGGEDEDNIPDMAEFEEPDNLIETDPVSYSQGHFSRSSPYMQNFDLFSGVELLVIFFLCRRGEGRIHVTIHVLEFDWLINCCQEIVNFQETRFINYSFINFTLILHDLSRQHFRLPTLWRMNLMMTIFYEPEHMM